MFFKRNIPALLAFNLTILQVIQYGVAIDRNLEDIPELDAIPDFYDERSPDSESYDNVRLVRSPRQDNHGNVNVDVNRTPGQGTHVRVEGNRDVWKSNDGRTRVEAGGHYDRTIGGHQGQPKQDYGGHVTFSHRFRRSAQHQPQPQPQPQAQPPHRGHFDIGIQQGFGNGAGHNGQPMLHVQANHDFWRSRNGMTTFEGGAFYDRNLGHRLPGMPRDNYGGQLMFTHRFKRSPEPEPSLQPLPPSVSLPQSTGGNAGSSSSSGNVNADISRTRGEGTHIHVDGNREVYKSQNGNTRVEAGGHYDRTIGGPKGQPKEHYGGHVTFGHRFKRSPQYKPQPQPQPQPPHHGHFDIGTQQGFGKQTENDDADVKFDDIDDSTKLRVRRSPQNENHRGNVNVEVNRTPEQGTHVRVEANRDVWKSNDGRTKVEAGGHYDRTISGAPHGQPRKDYGGHVTFSHRFKRHENKPYRDIVGEIVDNGYENFDDSRQLERIARSPQNENHRGNVNVEVNRAPEQGTHVRVEANRDLWKSNDGRTRVEANGYYDRNFGGNDGGYRRREDYGGRFILRHDF